MKTPDSIPEWIDSGGQQRIAHIYYSSCAGELMPPERVLTGMDKKILYLWCAYPDDFAAGETTQACMPLLSDHERARLREFQFERHRREYLATRTLVRSALSYHHSIRPENWRFQSNSRGKPAAVPDCGLRFNLSNSLGLVACLIAQGAEVGVDVEPYERAEEIAELAPEVFSPLELAQFEALRGQERLERALSLWTLKEAYIKARGMGLSLPLNQFSFLFGGTDGICLVLDPRLCDEPGRRWRFCLVEHSGHRIALMAEGAIDLDLELWEVRPLLAPPARLPAGEVSWFPAS